MKKTLHITAVLFILVFQLDAMNWPSENAVLLRNFGANENGRPVLGMIFSGETEVLAAEKGEVIFSHSKNNFTSRLPSPLGAWAAIDHGDGLISVYSRYEDKNITLTDVEKSQPIASSGISGWVSQALQSAQQAAAQQGFYFIIYDRRERRWINPAMIVTPAQVSRPVQIFSVELRNEQGLPVQSRNISQGRYTIMVNAASPVTGRPGVFLAPQRIVSSVNGAEAATLNFEAFSARDGVLMAYRNGLVPARQIYAAFPAFETAEVFLTRGQANLEIIVQDISGRSTSFAGRYIVN